MTPQDPSRRALADALWTEMAVTPELATEGSGLVGIYRNRVYNPLVTRSRANVLAHRSPEPWLTLRCILQAASGDGWRRSDRRFEGLFGGGTTEREYQLLLTDAVASPVMMVAGYPRSGTTSLQAVVRAAYRHHIPEIDTEDRRFSLWEEPKHSPRAIGTAARLGQEHAIAICAVRPFVDCAASLVVGRGGTQQVDVHAEKSRWEAWSDVYHADGAITFPFTAISGLTPYELACQIEASTGVGPDVTLAEDATYEDLIRATGKGSLDDPRQSNLPKPSRSGALADARSWVEEQLGASEVERLLTLYSSLPFVIDPAGTVDPS